MFLSKEQDYAIRAVRALSHMNLMTVKEVCDKENVPHPFAYKILKKLKTAGIVQSSVGVKGGYILVKTPSRISLFDILSAVDRNAYVSKCLKPGFECENDHDKNCLVRKTLRQVQSEIIYSLKGKTLDVIV